MDREKDWVEKLELHRGQIIERCVKKNPVSWGPRVNTNRLPRAKGEPERLADSRVFRDLNKRY